MKCPKISILKGLFFILTLICVAQIQAQNKAPQTKFTIFRECVENCNFQSVSFNYGRYSSISVGLGRDCYYFSIQITNGKTVKEYIISKENESDQYFFERPNEYNCLEHRKEDEKKVEENLNELLLDVYNLGNYIVDNEIDTRKKIYTETGRFAVLANLRNYAFSSNVRTTSSTQKNPNKNVKALEINVSLGRTANGFTFSRKGTLTYNGKSFSPVIAVNTKNIEKFRISTLPEKKMAGAIAVDIDGQNSLYFLDLNTMRATPMQEKGSWNAAQEIYWSPSYRYMIALCAYEGHNFARLDIQTKESEQILLSKPDGGDDTIWYLDGKPVWSKEGDALIFNVTEHCNPYESDNCNDRDKVLARYKVNLDATTMRISYVK